MRTTLSALTLLVLFTGCGREQQPKDNADLWRAPVPAQSPRCVFRLAPPYATHAIWQFNGAVKQFAKSNGFKERNLDFRIRYSGPALLEAVYERDDFAIWRWGAQPGGSFYVAPRTTNYDDVSFSRLTNSLATAIGTAFPGRLEVFRWTNVLTDRASTNTPPGPQVPAPGP